MAGIVRFHLLQSFTLTNRRALKSFINQLFKKEGYTLDSLDYIFCSDEYLLKINQDFLKHDDYTDIITFDLSESDEVIGEIYISIDRIKENSLTHNTSFTNELHRVIIHGALHLCGYKDKSKVDKADMTKRENYYLLKIQ
jgi:probable rRNA maturation factor